MRRRRLIALRANFVKRNRGQKYLRTAVPIAMFIGIVMIIMITIAFPFAVASQRCMVDVHLTVMALKIASQRKIRVAALISSAFVVHRCGKQRPRRKDAQALVMIKQFLDVHRHIFQHPQAIEIDGFAWGQISNSLACKPPDLTKNINWQ